MKKIKLLAIAPYAGLGELLIQLADQREDVQLTVRYGDLSSALAVAYNHLNDEYDAILSRGGTADLLRQNFQLPVIDISLSAYDVLRAIKLAQQYETRFAIAGFTSITEHAQMLCQLLQLDTKIVTFTDEACVSDELSLLQADGYDLILTDMIGSTIADQLSINKILITSGVESVQSSFDKAIQLIHSLTSITRQKEIFKQLVYMETDNVIVIHKNSRNYWFSHFQEVELREAVTELIQSHWSKLSNSKVRWITDVSSTYVLELHSKLITVENEDFLIIKILCNPFRKESLDSYSVYNNDRDVAVSFDAGSANYIGSIKRGIDVFAHVRHPVILVGEEGTGKDKAAQQLYNQGPFSHNPLFIINCSKLSLKQWHNLLEDSASPFYNVDTTIYFQMINDLTPMMFEELLELILASNMTSRNKLIFSIVKQVNTNDFSHIQALKQRLNASQLDFPALRERPEDIPSIITLYISKINMQLGKQILGCNNDALDMIKSYDWPGNLNQLYRVIRDLVLFASDYILKEDVEAFLSKEQSSLLKAPISAAIDLHKTLDELNYDIIKHVLKEEGYNKEKTAQRLGISRSTLWRKLNAYE